ncbi:MAG: class I SAM-dependent methyltransferase [Planctomycetota bacterium]
MVRSPKGRWQGAEAARRYVEDRWDSPRRAGRDPRLVRGALACQRVREPGAIVLDAPCGAARLRPAIEAGGTRWVGLDASPAMLAAACAAGRPLLVGDVSALPFADGAFDAVVCCRLLHHLAEEAAFRRAVAELVRVSRFLVVASFWDSRSLAAWRSRAFPRRDGRVPGRVTHARERVREAFAAAGAEVIEFRPAWRFLSRQTFAVARKTAASDHG